jgi:hypothetical protein
MVSKEDVRRKLRAIVSDRGNDKQCETVKSPILVGVGRISDVSKRNPLNGGIGWKVPDGSPQTSLDRRVRHGLVAVPLVMLAGI